MHYACVMDETNSNRLQLLIEHCAGAPITTGNDVARLKNGVEIFPAMLAAIHAAKESIEFLTFVYWTGDIADQFAEAMAEKAREGLTVRILLDAFGAFKIKASLLKMLKEAGCEVEWFRPLKWYSPTKIMRRTHRKILICDRTVGFTGGVGIASEWNGDARNHDEWRDSHFRVHGPAVCGLFAAFLHNWNETNGSWDNRWFQPCPAATNHTTIDNHAVQVICGSSTHGWSDIATTMQIILRSCHKRLYITTGYFQPDEAARQLLMAAVERGVEVIILHTDEAHTDKWFAHRAGQAVYQELLQAGVKIMEYQTTMLHAKVIIADDVILVGSANFNQRSMRHDEEVILTSSDEKLVATLAEDFKQDCAQSQAVKLTDWQQRSWWHKFTARVWLLFARHF